MARIGIVLSGGMAKGAYEIGALKCIREFFSDDEIAVVSASSVGVLNGYAFSVGKLQRAEEIWNSIDIKGKVKSLKRIVTTSFTSDIVDCLVDEDDEINCSCIFDCFDFTKRKLVYKDLQNIPKEKRIDYIKASVSMPVFSQGYRIDEGRYFDGALIDDIPVLPLKNMDLDYIIVVYFDKKSYTFENESFDSKVIKINFYDDALIKNFLSFDKPTVEKMINEGYIKTKSVLKQVLFGGKDDIPAVLSGIREFNLKIEKAEKRITCDVMVRNINKVVQRLLKNNNLEMQSEGTNKTKTLKSAIEHKAEKVNTSPKALTCAKSGKNYKG
ncbi:MAG: patatin-like phospholipase family protein [Ruminococcus sp.]